MKTKNKTENNFLVADIYQINGFLKRAQKGKLLINKKQIEIQTPFVKQIIPHSIIKRYKVNGLLPGDIIHFLNYKKVLRKIEGDINVVLFTEKEKIQFCSNNSLDILKFLSFLHKQLKLPLFYTSVIKYAKRFIAFTFLSFILITLYIYFFTETSVEMLFSFSGIMLGAIYISLLNGLLLSLFIPLARKLINIHRKNTF